jgi:adenine-specific DNA-methyltransferase
MDKLKMHTPNLADENFKKLSSMFPNAVTETMNENGDIVRAIDVDILQQEISGTVIAGGVERYQFTWPDKKKSVVLANQPINKTLRLDREKSVGRDGSSGSIDTENIYIEGDNLDVLKLLQETYLEKVKMIYIDPPYNTGNDFIYEDDFSQNTEDYLDYSGQADDYGNRLVHNSETNGRFHTDWLNMIYPRLKLAKDLLAKDGIVFISIDDNEYGNLKKICDEIFGHLIASFTVVVKTEGRRYGGVAKTHEYILIYAKTNEYTLNEIEIEGKKFRYSDAKGGFNIQELRNQNARAFNSTNRPNLRYPFFVDEKDVDNNGFCKVYLDKNEGLTEVLPITTNGYKSVWRWGRNEKARTFLDELIARRGDDGVIRIYQKMRKLTEMPKSVLINKDFLSIKGTRELETLLGKTVFDFPKPTELISLLLKIGSQKDSLVLDFFSGSATTAHAVMKLNAEDGGNRKFIMVQLPEKCSYDSEAHKAGFENICDIGEERIRMAGNKIKKDNPSTDVDIGFRVLKIDSSNMYDVYYKPDDYTQEQMDLFACNIKEDRTPEDLLFQVMIDLGVELSSKIEEQNIYGKKVFVVGGGYTDRNSVIHTHLIACFDDKINDDTVKAIAEKHPAYAVFRDSGMENDSVATNFDQIFETYSPETVRKVL